MAQNREDNSKIKGISESSSRVIRVTARTTRVTKRVDLIYNQAMLSGDRLTLTVAGQKSLLIKGSVPIMPRYALPRRQTNW